MNAQLIQVSVCIEQYQCLSDIETVTKAVEHATNHTNSSHREAASTRLHSLSRNTDTVLTVLTVPYVILRTSAVFQGTVNGIEQQRSPVACLVIAEVECAFVRIFLTCCVLCIIFFGKYFQSSKRFIKITVPALYRHCLLNLPENEAHRTPQLLSSTRMSGAFPPPSVMLWNVGDFTVAQIPIRENKRTLLTFLRVENNLF